MSSRKVYSLCSGRSSADANQEEWLERMHLNEEAGVKQTKQERL